MDWLEWLEWLEWLDWLIDWWTDGLTDGRIDCLTNPTTPNLNSTRQDRHTLDAVDDGFDAVGKERIVTWPRCRVMKLSVGSVAIYLIWSMNHNKITSNYWPKWSLLLPPLPLSGWIPRYLHPHDFLCVFLMTNSPIVNSLAPWKFGIGIDWHRHGEIIGTF